MSIATTLEAGINSVKGKWQLVLVPGGNGQYWKPLIEDFMKGGKRQLPGPVLYTYDQLAEMLDDGGMQLWLGGPLGSSKPCCFMITELLNYPAGKTCNICLVGGKYLWPIAREFFTPFLAWTKEMDCNYIECVTVPALVKVLKKLGFQPTGVRLHFPITQRH